MAIVTAKYQGKTAKFIVTDETDSIQKCWIDGRFYEAGRNGILNWIWTNRKKIVRGTAIDCGAHMGNHTIFLTKVIGRCEVLAIEPESSANTALKANVKNNRVGKWVKVFHAAAGAENGKCAVETSDVPPENGGSGMSAVKFGKGDTIVITIDEISDDHYVSLIKIDCEGSEMEVLQGSVLTIKQDKPIVIVETDDYFQVAAWLGKFGYKPVEYKDNEGNFKPVMFNHTATYIFEHKE